MFRSRVGIRLYSWTSWFLGFSVATLLLLALVVLLVFELFTLLYGQPAFSVETVIRAFLVMATSVVVFPVLIAKLLGMKGSRDRDEMDETFKAIIAAAPTEEYAARMRVSWELAKHLDKIAAAYSKTHEGYYIGITADERDTPVFHKSLDELLRILKAKTSAPVTTAFIGEPEIFDVDEVRIVKSGSSKSPKLTINVAVNGTPVEMKLDTGAGRSIWTSASVGRCRMDYDGGRIAKVKYGDGTVRQCNVMSALLKFGDDSELPLKILTNDYQQNNLFGLDGVMCCDLTLKAADPKVTLTLDDRQNGAGPLLSKKKKQKV